MTKFIAQGVPTSFEGKILYFNNLYKLPIAPVPSVVKVAEKESVSIRIQNFMKTLSEEISEGNAILRMIEGKDILSPEEELNLLTELSDWLADIVIYCYSEAAKYGIPMKQVLDVIMMSNFSKLSSEGTPIYNESGKVMKGPNYWKPEPEIKETLKKFIADRNEWTS